MRLEFRNELILSVFLLENTGCDGKVDVVFLVDSSNSMIGLSPFGDPLYAWRQHQTFLKQVVSQLPVGSESRVGLVTYATTPHLVFHFQQHSTSINVQDAISLASFQGGNTNSAAALRAVRETLTLQAESRSRRVVVALTDGLTNMEESMTELEAVWLRAQGAEIFAIAVSREHDPVELMHMASSPYDRHIITLSGVDDLNASLALILAHRICGIGDPMPTTASPPSCLPGCTKCQDDDVCLECAHGFFRHNNMCVGMFEFLYAVQGVH